MKLNEMYMTVARDLGVSVKHVKDVYQGYWAAVREYISSVPLKEDITEEEFSNIKTTVNIPSLGKFHIEWERLKSKKDSYERYKNKKAETTI